MAVTTWTAAGRTLDQSTAFSTPGTTQTMGQQGVFSVASVETTLLLEERGTVPPLTGLLWPRPETVVYVEEPIFGRDYMMTRGE